MNFIDRSLFNQLQFDVIILFLINNNYIIMELNTYKITISHRIQKRMTVDIGTNFHQISIISFPTHNIIDSF